MPKLKLSRSAFLWGCLCDHTCCCRATFRLWWKLGQWSRLRQSLLCQIPYLGSPGKLMLMSHIGRYQQVDTVHFSPHQSRKWTLHAYEMCALSECFPAAVSGGVSFRKQRCLVKSQDCLPAICGRVPGGRDRMCSEACPISSGTYIDGCSFWNPTVGYWLLWEAK